MSAVAGIKERIQDTAVRIAEYEKALLLPGAPHSLTIAIRSLEKLQAGLERDFARLVKEEESQILRYRLLPKEGTRQSISAIADAWKKYQDYFTAVYVAVVKKHGARIRPVRIMRAECELAFGYTFAGSIGVVLTLPSGMDYLKSRDIQEASEIANRMAKAQDANELASFAEAFGVASVSRLRDWTDTHVDFSAGAALEWDIVGEPRPPLFIQVEEFQRLKTAISRFEEPTVTERDVAGILLGASVKRHRFEMVLDSGEDVDGKFKEAITIQHTAELPKHYYARIRTTVTVNTALEKRDVEHFLVQLSDQPPPNPEPPPDANRRYRLDDEKPDDAS